jgi:tRNA U34 2-thiouridine synthase MnmA/TrmU
MIKAIALLSGGLDSILATRLVLNQGISVEAVNFVTVFCTCTTKGKTCLASKTAADNLGVKLKVFEISDEYFEVIKNPKYGYGSNINPCLDCRIFMFRKAGEYMRTSGASFVFTGEVLGERPMSQRKDAMRIIERDSGLERLILRPLSAGLLKPTLPEDNGWVDRSKLLSIMGRSRKPQIQLAKELGINDYPCPAGGCLLTDPGFANRMRDLIKYKPAFTINDVLLLKIGRHFRLSAEAKIIVGRNKEENNKLSNLAQEKDLYFYPIGTKGPIAVGRGIFSQENITKACSIVTRYSDDAPNLKYNVAYRKIPAREGNTIPAISIGESDLEDLRI